MPAKPNRRDDPSIWEKFGFSAQIALSAASLLSLVLVLTDSVRGAISTQAILIGVVVVLYVGSAIFFIRYLRRTRYVDFRIALTGAPGAGKTVFSLLLYDYLMNARTNWAEFTADSKSAIATYQAIRGISVDEWPTTTAWGSVVQYDGTIRFRRRLMVDLEIGDSAGEHWLNLMVRRDQESDYIQWVLSAQGIVHVISVETLIANAMETLSQDVDDLKLAASLMRSTKRGDAAVIPLLVVISKMDLVGVHQADDLMRLHSHHGLHSSRLIDGLNIRSSTDIGMLLTRLATDLERDYRSVTFVFASIELATKPERLGLVRSEDALQWIYDSAMSEVRRGRTLPTFGL